MNATKSRNFFSSSGNGIDERKKFLTTLMLQKLEKQIDIALRNYLYIYESFQDLFDEFSKLYTMFIEIQLFEVKFILTINASEYL